MIKRKLTLIMENKPGALVRVVGLFHQRGYNIESLHVDPVDDFTPYKFIEEQLETKFKENEIYIHSDDIEMKNPIRTLGEHEISVSPYLNITHTLKIKVNKN